MTRLEGLAEMNADPAPIETERDGNVIRAFGHRDAPAAVHCGSVEDALVALSSLLQELVDHARGNQHSAEIDVTITRADDGLRIGAASLRERSTIMSRRPLTLMLNPLTEAEERVLTYLPTHLTFAAIADECFVSRNTVKTHAISIYRKLGVRTRHNAVAVAQELGLFAGS